MNEEETVDDAKAAKEAEVEATQMSTSSKTEKVKSNNTGSQMMSMDNQSTESISFLGKIKKFVLSLFLHYKGTASKILGSFFKTTKKDKI
ncbi:hypothetical protein [Peribacillus sp. NPDC096540]|uniref:hypothetical protein n=1 Tax=Peribacillus sp. NPDC096540 TaxID=3390612 RepID=UPI003D05B1C8